MEEVDIDSLFELGSSDSSSEEEMDCSIEDEDQAPVYIVPKPREAEIPTHMSLINTAVGRSVPSYSTDKFPGLLIYFEMQKVDWRDLPEQGTVNECKGWKCKTCRQEGDTCMLKVGKEKVLLLPGWGKYTDSAKYRVIGKKIVLKEGREECIRN